MKLSWQLAEAKSKFSEVVRKALLEGPQRITRRDEAVMLISETEYRRLTGKKKSLIEYLSSAPDGFNELALARDKSGMRDVDL